MPKFSLLTIVSLFFNIFLTFWLVNQYVSDVYFQNYVNNAFGQYYAFIVLTVGVGGGSSLGYLFLKKRHADGGLVSKIQKSKSFKPVGPLASPSASSTSRSILPTGAPPSQLSKHTVYAVPPLPKSTSPSSSRSLPSTSWAAASKPSAGTIPLPKQEVPNKPGTTSFAPPTSIAPPKEPSRPGPSSFAPSIQQPAPPRRSIGETPARSSTWSLPPTPSDEKSGEGSPIFQKPGLDTSAKQGQGFSSYSPPAKTQDSSPVPSKWAPPPQENRPAPSQWGDTGVRSIPPLPTKWSPPPSSPGVQDRPPAPPQTVPRPGPLPQRGPMPPPPQNAPRPFGIANPVRSGEPRPIAAPQPFRPNPMRPPPPLGAPNPQQRPPQPLPRPSSSPSPVGGPMPQPWSPSSGPAEKKEPSSLDDLQDSLGRSSSEPKPNAEPSTGGGGEMDWDTALDTILKTLRKDRVGDTK